MNNLKKDLETCNQTIIDKLETLKQDSLTTKDEMKLKAELAKEEAEYNLEKFQDKAEATKDNLIRDGKKEVEKLKEKVNDAYLPVSKTYRLIKQTSHKT